MQDSLLARSEGFSRAQCCLQTGKTLTSHLRDLGADVTPPRVCVGRYNAAVVADAQLTLHAEIATVEDQAECLEAASALSLPHLLGPVGAFLFDLQQLILQPPVWQREQNVRGWWEKCQRGWSGVSHVLTVSSSPLASSVSRLSAAPSGSSPVRVPAERRSSAPLCQAPLVPQSTLHRWIQPSVEGSQEQLHYAADCSPLCNIALMIGL